MRRIATLIIAVLALTATACTPAQIEAFLDLGPRPLTAETMTPTQRTIVAYLQAEQGKFLHAAATRPSDCYSAMEQVWPPHLWVTGRRIIARESGNNPAAQNPVSTAAGCWQMLRMHAHRFDAVGCAWAQRYDAMCNTRAAWKLYQDAGGWSPWALTAY